MRIQRVVFGMLLASGAYADQVVAGNVRIQTISPTILRLEQRGPRGFEDRATFTIVSRFGPGASIQERASDLSYSVSGYRIVLPPNGNLSGVRVYSPNGKLAFQYDGKLPAASYLPSPGKVGTLYAVADSPRLVPPPWGATPASPIAPIDPDLIQTSGWDTRNDAPDIYLFLTPTSDYRKLVSDYLSVLGKPPLPPLYTFGLWDSRYYPYRQQEALDTIDKYRSRGFPLDLFVVDTDWRVGASKGYAVNTKLFPDMAAFIADAHRRDVRIMFNDHPEPQTATALDPVETKYRWDGHTGVMAMGMDVWWFDRNWSTSLHEPMPGLRKELWGMRVFQDIAKRFRPTQRPLIMSNVQGVDNGERNYPSQPGAHRYPIQWTGDTGAYWSYLQRGVRNGVDLGLISLLGYVNEDLGGHWAHPTNELYVRYLQYGAFSPVMRIHCTAGETRYPWEYGDVAESIVRAYVRMRYALLPTIYSAARRNHEDGTPILRRCDLEWPEFPEATDSSQYLFGDDLLVAPIITSKDDDATPVPAKMVSGFGGGGFQGEYFPNEELKGTPVVKRESKLDFNWGTGSPDPSIPSDHFSARWSATLGPVPETGEYLVGSVSDDGARVWLDGKLLVDKWVPQAGAIHTATIRLEKGKTYPLKVEYFERTGGADIKLLWLLPSKRHDLASRTVWIPPGTWFDRWTGQRLDGPKSIRVEAPLWKMPMFIRAGGALLTAPFGRASSPNWPEITVDVWAPVRDGETKRTLYEDDGISNGYAGESFAKTTISVTRRGPRLTVQVAPREGTYPGARLERTYRVKLHDASAKSFAVSGGSADVSDAPEQGLYGWGSYRTYSATGVLASRGARFEFTLSSRG